MDDRLKFLAIYKGSEVLEYYEHNSKWVKDKRYVDMVRHDEIKVQECRLNRFNEQVIEPEYYDIKDFEVMRCTGLKDKDGTLVFEGDICKATVDDRFFEWRGESKPTLNPTYNRIYEVKFVSDESCHCFMLINYDNINKQNYNEHGKHCFDRVLIPRIIKECGIKIIGNIYQDSNLLTKNAELLEEK